MFYFGSFFSLSHYNYLSVIYKGKKPTHTQLTFTHTHTHSLTYTPSGSLEQARFVFGFSFTLVMPLSRDKKHLIPDFLLLALGLWPAKWNVFFYCWRPASCWVEWREEKIWKKRKKRKKWNDNVALPFELAKLYKELKVSLASRELGWPSSYQHLNWGSSGPTLGVSPSQFPASPTPLPGLMSSFPPKRVPHGVTISVRECGWGKGSTNKWQPLEHPDFSAPWVPIATKQK